MEHRRQIKQFILKNYLFTDDEKALADGDSLIKNGVIDSTGVLELIMFLEETFAVKIAEEEMIPANLDSIDAIGAFLATKQGR